MTSEQLNEIYRFYLRYWWDRGRMPHRDYLARHYGLPTAEIDAAKDALTERGYITRSYAVSWPTILGRIRHHGITYALTPP